jgi:phosphoglycolate phosphatase-like HAD superfamily hydrolase
VTGPTTTSRWTPGERLAGRLPVPEPTPDQPVVGVLALQGDVLEHLRALRRCGAAAVEVRSDEQLAADEPADHGAETFRDSLDLEAYLEAYEKAHADLTEPFPGIIDALRLLRECGVSAAVVTGKGPVSALISLKRLGLEQYFGVVETGSPDGPVKPESLRKVLTRWGTEPHEAAYLGDVAYDMEAAAEVGMMALGARWAEGSSVREAHPKILEAVFDDVGAFTTWLETHVP